MAVARAIFKGAGDATMTQVFRTAADEDLTESAAIAQAARVLIRFLGGDRSIQLSYGGLYDKYSIFRLHRIRTNCRLGGERSILLSYRDLYEIELVTITFGFELIG